MAAVSAHSTGGVVLPSRACSKQTVSCRVPVHEVRRHIRGNCQADSM